MKRWLVGIVLIVILLFLHHTPAAQGSIVVQNAVTQNAAGMFQGDAIG